MSLSLFPIRVPIGRATSSDGRSFDVLMTPEFSRALSDVFKRIGGSNGMGSDDLALLESFDTAPANADLSSAAGHEDAALSAQVAALRAEVDALRSELSTAQGLAAVVQQLEELRFMVGMLEDPGAAVRYLSKMVATPSNAVPRIAGVGAAGSALPYSREDHVHPADVDGGNFTPTLTFGGAAVGMTYATRTGNWQRNGKAVTISGRITLSSKGTSVGEARLEGWPAALAPIGDVGVTFALVASMAGGPLDGVIDAGATSAGLTIRGPANDVSAGDSNFTNNTLMRFTMTFTIA